MILYPLSQKSLSSKTLLIFGIILISLVFIPYVFWGENAHIRVHDNLDSNVVWVKMILNQSGIFMPPLATVYQPMDGLPHSSVYSCYDLSLIGFSLFGTFWGYIFNMYIIALIGFFGMYFLLKKFVLTSTTSSYIIFGVALCYGLLPFWSFTASVAGLPFIFYLFLNIRSGNNKIWYWIGIILYGFYSSLILTGVFFLLLMSCLLIYDTIVKKRFNKFLLLAIITLTSSYIISHLPLFMSHLSPSFISHRTEFGHVFDKDTGKAIKRSIYLFLKGDSYGLDNAHAMTLHRYAIISVILAFVLMIWRKSINKLFIVILAFIVFSTVLYGFMEWSGTEELREIMNEIIPIDVKRFYWFQPLCWYLLMAISFATIHNSGRYGKYIALAFLLFQIGYVFQNQDYFINKWVPTYKQFYSEKQFDEIKSYIGKDLNTYRVLSIGLIPAISQYNGMYTLDGFSADYPVEYKHKFGKMMDAELKKDENLYNYFHLWGSCCCAFSGELGPNYMWTYKAELPEIQHLQYDFDILRQLGGNYILSATKINIDNIPDMRFMKVFKSKEYYWTIYLYEILPRNEKTT